ncbi:YigZ family protein [Vulcanibacillus modesticaldus]|uniref:YigZ family protein n=1 Tax=Vulcanibacillus modesticaldus TaxID=337097 RepID=A0A1D2YVM0_9BACI|nr:YigZ family protein [Vulcanibacillus modesticaldus]OEF99769.1 YigZ family protein [Vulcanibacillus modesticaldus]
MLERYLTVNEYGEKAIIIRKSEFIGYVKNVTTEEEAIKFIDSIKKKHWNATHNCSAYVIGENDEIQKANDDGEPSGTAGKPILEVIKKNGLKDTVIVVTRYFGGIMLGAGGLIRAYGQAANEAIHEAGIIERILHTVISITVDYTWLGKIENELNNKKYQIEKIDYLENVTIYVLAEAGKEEQLEKLITNLTSGQAKIARIEQKYVDIPYSKKGA